MKRTALLPLCCSLLLSGCAFHTHITDLHGVPGLRGVPTEYQSTSKWALHGLFVFPLIGDAGLEQTVSDFSAEAANRGATRLHITQTGKTTYWFVLPPLSFFLHPVNSTVEGHVEGTSGFEPDPDGD